MCVWKDENKWKWEGVGPFFFKKTVLDPGAVPKSNSIGPWVGDLV